MLKTDQISFHYFIFHFGIQKINFNNYLADNEIKLINRKLNEIVKSYNFFLISENLTIDQNQELYQNFEKSEILVINQYEDKSSKTKADYILIGFEKSIIIINQSSFDFIQSLLMTKSEINICFLPNMYNTKSVFDENIGIKYTEIENTTIKSEISNFGNLVVIKSHDKDRIQIWKSIQECIFGYLIKQSYFKKRNSRIELFFTKYKNRISNVIKIDINQLISFRTIGIGSSFIIYLDYYITKEELIVKKIPFGSSNEHLKLINREIENYKELNHPFLPQFIGLTSDKNYLIIEYINGLTLDQYLNKYHLDDTDKFIIIFELMIIIEFLHYKKFIYRDLKPNNVIIDENKTVVLIDLDRLIHKDTNIDEINYTNVFSSS